MDTRDAFVAKLKAQLDEWNAELDQMEARSRKVQADQLVAYHEHIAVIRRHCDDAQQRIAQIQQATGNAWEEMTQGAEEAWARIGQGFVNARVRLDELKST